MAPRTRRRCRPRAAARASFSMTHGRPRRRSRASPQRQVVPAEVDREGDGAGRRVDAAGHADADARDVVGRAPASARARSMTGGDRVGGAVLVGHGGGVVARPRTAPSGLDDEDGDLGAADVDADDGAGARWPSRPVAGRRVIGAPSGRARGQQQRAGAEERQVLADAAVDDPGLAGERAEAAAGGLVADRRRATARRGR